jgi:RNA polymerase sigma-70 factor (ECF subfamily)
MTTFAMSDLREPEVGLPSGGASGGPVEAAIADARLVDAARQGDRDAFGHLVTRYERRLVSVILRFVHDVELARDLAQETFLKAYQRLDQFDPSRRFGPWLFRIGVNQTLDYLRRRSRRGWISLFTDAGTERQPDPAVPDPRERIDLEQEVRLILDMIPEKYRTVLVLRDLENFSSSEIAAILHRKEATIRWRLAEARNRFQKLWERRRGAPVATIDPAESTEDELPNS